MSGGAYRKKVDPMNVKKSFIRIFSCLLATVLAITVLASCAPVAEEDGYEKLELIDSLFRSYSLFEFDEEALMDAVLKGYVEGTGDKYAEYFTAEEYERFTSDGRGEMVGIGINVIQNTEYGCIEILNVIPDSPALEAGLLPEDLIVYVGIGESRQSVEELGYSNAIDMLAGEEGSVAEITVSRGGEELEFSLVRRKVTSLSVTGKVCDIDEKVGIVRISGFDLTTPGQFTTAVDELLSKGCDRFVFDVRYNPGGDLRSIRAVLSYFLNKGDVFIRTSDKSGKIESEIIEPIEYSAAYSDCNVTKEDIGKYRELSIAVLVNGSTASAAELFTSALMDHGLSVTVGSTTFGKGTMQSTYSLARYGYGGAIKLTTDYYYPPFSDSYDGVGIIPDREVELDEALAGININKIADSEDNQLLAAIEELNK